MILEELIYLEDDTFGLPNIYTVTTNHNVDVAPLTSGQYSVSSTELSTVSDITVIGDSNLILIAM
jgi:hypothetical protein